MAVMVVIVILAPHEAVKRGRWRLGDSVHLWFVEETSKGRQFVEEVVRVSLLPVIDRPRLDQMAEKKH